MKLSLIQVHYHLRAGGVSTVMRRYSEMFSKLTCCEEQSFVFCSENESAGDAYTKIIQVKECEYKKYTNEFDYITDRKKIEFLLDKCIAEQHQNGHVVVIAHNLALGKNLALTSAFYNCAKNNTLDSITFYSVLHDFSEEGRISEIEAIKTVECFQNDIKRQMYCIDVPVKIIVPNRSMMHMLQACGFDVSLVSNPVNCDTIKIDKKNIENLRHFIFDQAHKLQLPFDNKRKIAYYPVRIIPRKNIYEAILISCIFFESSLITGPSGGAELDTIRYSNLDNFIRRNQLPVMTDIVAKCDLQIGKNQVETIMFTADFVVSTSIAEGFGYTLFEPWIQQTMLIARKIPGYSMPDGWDDESMYSFLPVPVKWISMEIVNNCYNKFFSECFGKHITWSVQELFVKGIFIDFAVLPECIQISIIELILNDRTKRNEWLTLLEKNIDGWPGLQKIYNKANRSISYHSKIVSSEFNEIVFKKTFSEVFLKNRLNGYQQANYQKIEKHFQSPDYFRLLLGNQNCRICDK